MDNVTIQSVWSIVAALLASNALVLVFVKFYLDRKVERLKNELQLRSMEHQIRYARLHEKRADVIAEINMKLVRLHAALEDYVQDPPPSVPSWAAKPKNLLPALRRSKELQSYFDAHRIYLPEALLAPLESVTKEYTMALIGLGISETQPGDLWPEGDTPMNRPAVLEEAVARIRRHLPSLRVRLESEFRVLLGDPPPAKR